MDTQSNSRRHFLKKIGGAGAGLAAASVVAKAADSTPSRPSGAKYMGDFIAPKLDTIKVAIIGCGARGGTHFNHVSAFEGTEFVGICDLHQDLCERAKKKVLANGKGKRHQNVKLYHGDKHAYKKMLKETKPDLVYVVTPWEWHAPMAIDAMNAGAHVAVEVPLTTTIKETWELIDTSEKTQKHCMMLENVNYGRDELMYLNMCRLGIFGDILHGEAAYIHELRGQMRHVENGRGTGSWRTYHWAKKSGNLYPTHGLGPVAQYMNLARGDDNFRRIVSFSSPAKNHALYAKKHFKPDSELNKITYEGGDMSTSIIKTTLGRTVMVQWDESSPRPYSRHNLIQGTKGTGAGFPTRIALDYGKDEGLPEKLFKALAGDRKHTNYHGWAQGDKIKAFYEAFDHPLYKRMADVAKKMGGHGGMDAIMNFRVIECLRKGQPLDQNVYEGAFWSAVTPLSMKSVAEDGMPQDFPDFTRGQWKNTKPLPIVQ
ncbi:Gfo/Idh/MocA family oxidoreductase [Verrucomicrobiaceae bacterium N1E253]|uniref:Gfo/Idh/MocA family oxidoreductase n=1 Tax=Oceaniferula marina TaxID=2748318 RepID=A0A851GFR1_9BACT|nr:Gfo/Idh/MocA family oxidoreductase [Oceaniferula marina]NWK56608.1 Gfo/Idh/MocA family oxidoreductase [Oceaniferula marina]